VGKITINGFRVGGHSKNLCIKCHPTLRKNTHCDVHWQLTINKKKRKKNLLQAVVNFDFLVEIG